MPVSILSDIWRRRRHQPRTQEVCSGARPRSALTPQKSSPDCSPAKGRAAFSADALQSRTLSATSPVQALPLLQRNAPGFPAAGGEFGLAGAALPSPWGRVPGAPAAFAKCKGPVSVIAVIKDEAQLQAPHQSWSERFTVFEHRPVLQIQTDLPCTSVRASSGSKTGSAS